MARELMLFPATVLDRPAGKSVRLRSGWGKYRGRHELSEPESAKLASNLLQLRTPSERSSIKRALQNDGDLPDEAAEALVDYLEDESVLVPPPVAEAAFSMISAWAARGWRQAAVHTIAGFGLPFQPDDDGGANYDAVYQRLLSDTSTPPQPPAFKGVPANYLSRLPLPDNAHQSSVTLEDVLCSAIQVYAYEPHSLDLATVHRAVHNTFRNQRVIQSGLGDALMRSYPSGGARHPLEAYVISKGAGDHEAGVYYYEPESGDLYLINGDPTIGEQLDNACFLKRGVRSSNFAVGVSVRWLRHIWKYRYSRSYRMILLEVGHAIQSLSFNSLADSVQPYYCPSYNDSALNAMCGLDDPYEESVAMVMSLGRNGLTVEQYREAYDTNA